MEQIFADRKVGALDIKMGLKFDTANSFIKGKIQDVIIYSLKKFVDERGWLAELFRHDDLAEEFYPVMAYISVTEPNVQRGPHEHVEQADLFCRSFKF
jgi:dTDP-4-dehydrorhamnose 3,5-epimerase